MLLAGTLGGVVLVRFRIDGAETTRVSSVADKRGRPTTSSRRLPPALVAWCHRPSLRSERCAAAFHRLTRRGA